MIPAVAEQTKLLQDDFLDMSVYPLCKVAAMEVKVVTSTRREGILRLPVRKGELRLLTSAEYSSMLQRQTGEEAEIIGNKLKIIPVQASEKDVISSTWVRFPPNMDSASALMQAELLEIESFQNGLLIEALEDFSAKWNWFISDLMLYLQLSEAYEGRPICLHGSYDRIMTFPRAYMQCLSDNLEDQMAGEGSEGQRATELLKEVSEIANLSEESFKARYRDKDNVDDEEDEVNWKIPLLQFPPQRNSSIVLSNVIDLEARWLYPFDPEETFDKGLFFLPNNKR